MKKFSLKGFSVLSLSAIVAGFSAIAPASALEILSNNYSMAATNSKMSAQELCTSAGLVSTDPSEGVTWSCSSANLDTTTAGRYSVNITAKDGEGNKSVKTIQVKVTGSKKTETPATKPSTGNSGSTGSAGTTGSTGNSGSTNSGSQASKPSTSTSGSSTSSAKKPSTTTTVSKASTYRSGNTEELPATGDTTALTLSGLAVIGLGSVAALSRKRKEVTE